MEEGECGLPVLNLSIPDEIECIPKGHRNEFDDFIVLQILLGWTEFAGHEEMDSLVGKTRSRQ